MVNEKKIDSHNVPALDLQHNPALVAFIAACAVPETKPYRFRVGDRELSSMEFAHYLLFLPPEVFRFERLFRMSPRHWLTRFAGAVTDVVRDINKGDLRAISRAAGRS